MPVNLDHLVSPFLIVFEVPSGRMCLDFANTMIERRTGQPRELLSGYSDLVSWGLEARAVTGLQARRLAEMAERRPADAAAAFEQAITWREAIYRIFSSLARSESPVEADLTVFNDALKGVMPMAQVTQTEEGFAWDWEDDEDALDRILWPVVRSAADLLTSQELAKVKVCPDREMCAWLFVDTSRNQSRRWCDMKSCGNRAKARQHYQQRKTATEQG